MENINNKQIYICDICEKKFNKKNDYKRHKNRKIKCSKDIIIDNKKIYECNECNKKFNIKCNYLKHLQRKNKCFKINNIDIITTRDNNLLIPPQLPQNLPQLPQNLSQLPQILPQKKNILIDKNTCCNCNKIFSRLD